MTRKFGVNPALLACLLCILQTTAKGTFSIVAYDPGTGDLGVAVQSKFFGVGSVVPWAESGIGAVATQARANVRFGPLGIKLMSEGLAPDKIRKVLIDGDSG